MSAIRRSRELSATAKARIRLHLWLVPVYVWIAFSWSAYASDISVAGRYDRNGHIKGHDFAHFYVLGRIGLDRASADLYSYERQAARTDELVTTYQDRFQPAYGPQVALFMAPFAAWRYEIAVPIWLVISAALYFACCFALWRSLPSLRTYGPVVALLAIGLPPFYAAIAAGQTSTFALACFTLGYFAFRADRPFLAGIALGALAYKPTFALVLPCAVIAARQWRTVTGAVVAAAIQLAAACLWFGPHVLADYFSMFRAVAPIDSLNNPDPYQMHSLRSFFALLAPSIISGEVAYIIASLATIAAAVWFWRSDASLADRYAALLLSSVLVDPHVNAYDLVVLAPAFLLMASSVITLKLGLLAWGLLYAGYALPGLSGLTRLTSLQLSVPVLVALLVFTMRRARAQGNR